MNSIGIDGRVLKYNQRSGVEEYTEKVLENMVSLDSSIKFKIFFSGLSGEIKPRPWFYRSNVELFNFKIPNKLISLSAISFNKPQVDKLMNVDRFFSPHVLSIPLSKSCKRITTFHDLSFERFPEFFSVKQSLWHKFQMVSSVHARLSDKIISVSNSTKKDLINIYGVDPAKIEVIHPGINESLKISEDLLSDFKLRNNVPNKYFIYLGTLEPRKNVGGVIEAFNKLADRNPDINLVIAGRKGWLYKNIFKAINESKFKDRIRYLDYINDEDRAYWLSLSQGLVYPSFFEGFGFPVLEAMHLNVPVITSRNSSLVEVVGSSGLLVNPHDPLEISLAMETILNNENLRKDLVTSAKKRSQNFSWHKCAENTLKLILEA